MTDPVSAVLLTEPPVRRRWSVWIAATAVSVLLASAILYAFPVLTCVPCEGTGWDADNTTHYFFSGPLPPGPLPEPLQRFVESKAPSLAPSRLEMIPEEARCRTCGGRGRRCLLR